MGRGKEFTFARHGWWLTSNPHLVLVHYTGDENEYEPRLHGNSKSSKPFIRTCPSLLKDITQKVQGSDSSEIYKELTVKPCPNSLDPVLRPRNLKQVQNIKAIESATKRISKDSIYNLSLLAYEFKDYIFQIITFPDLTVFFGYSPLLKEVNDLLDTNFGDKLLLSYDTTFNLGDFYVTPVVFRHFIFQNSPCIPLAFMLHQRKYQTLHEDFIRHLCRRIRNFQKSKCAIVTDREKGIMNAIELELPNAKLLLCWNHLRQDIRRWLRLHKAKQQDTSVYMVDIKVLLNCESLENFEDEYKSMSTKWSSAFKEYFDERVKSDISNHAGRWILTQFGSYINHSGITNNMSESMNPILKRLLEWKEVQCDSAVLSFRFLQVYYHNELLRGLCGTGSFRLKPEFLRCQQSLEDIEFPKEVCAP